MGLLLRLWEAKYGVILMCAVSMLIFAIILSQFPDLPQAAPLNKGKTSETSSTGGVMPLGYVEAARPIRDPFAVPEEFRPNGQLHANVIKEKTVVKSEPSNVASRQPRSKVPELIGVIRGNERQAVILKFGEKSRTCQIGQQIGGFTVLSVEASAVVLNGPTGNISVHLKGDL